MAIGALTAAKSTAAAPSSRYPPGSSRPVANFSQTLGPGSRPPIPTATARPGSSMNFNQSVQTRQQKNARSRPATAMGDRGNDIDVGLNQQPNGTDLSPTLQIRKQRTRKMRSAVSHDSLASQSQRSRDISILSRKMGGLSIHDKPADTRKTRNGGQVITKQREQSSHCGNSAPDSKCEAPSSRRVREEGAARPQFRPAEFSRPTTPTQNPNVKLELEKMETLLKSVCLTPGSPTKSSSPVKLSFLNKESNLKSFTAWDVDERLLSVENQFKVMKEAMNVSLTDRKTLEDAVDLAKTRGKFLDLAPGAKLTFSKSTISNGKRTDWMKRTLNYRPSWIVCRSRRCR